ncbi:MAG: TMEM175 family protein [Janthinobacterium lividum]
MKTTRLEAFSDGVIAVIITVMVLELHVPQQSGLAGLWHLAPRLGLYALSFAMTAVYWINHHEILRRTESANYRVLWANMFFLFTLSLIPFFTDYVGEKHFDSFSTALYAFVMLLAGQGFLVLRLSLDGLRRKRGEVLPRTSQLETAKHIACLLLYIAAIPTAYYKPLLSLCLNILVTLIWIVPELGLHKTEACVTERTGMA